MSAPWFDLPAAWPALAAARGNAVLLATLRPDHDHPQSLLFLDPVEVVEAGTLDAIPALFDRLEAASGAGLHAAGFVGYECGYHFQGLDSLCPPVNRPLAWFGLFREPARFDHRTNHIEGVLPPAPIVPPLAAPPLPDAVTLEMAAGDYAEKIARLQEFIGAGDIYQANYTTRVRFAASAPAAALFAELARRQPVAYAALLHCAGGCILSFSPELFFARKHGRIWTRPMKGTLPRGLDLAEDQAQAARLANDEKNRAEHVMIVDLLRNDLGRVCEPGSVVVEDLFTVETYRTLLQMTSTIAGRLCPGAGLYGIFRSLFPGGSITGAPKIRAMQILREMEAGPRGVYTGAIGHIAPGGEARFNIAIRTLELDGPRGTMGVGGGIVADSRADDEYLECQWKAGFLTRVEPEFELLETILWDRGYEFLDLHLDRMEASAAYFAFRFDREAVLAQLAAAAAHWRPGEHCRARLLADRQGRMRVEATPFDSAPPTGRVRLAPERTDSGDVFLRHKTTHRARYDRLYREARAAGFDEVIFLNQRGEVTEGAISNIFVERGGRILTPPVTCGVLPGVYRRHWLDTDARLEERVLEEADLASADAVYLANSVRGRWRVEIALEPRSS